MQYEQIPEGVSRLLHKTVSENHRIEYFNPDAKDTLEYDARVMFLAHARYMPTYLRTPGSFIRDDGSDMVPYRQGWYKTRVTVPSHWRRIGLVPSGLTTISGHGTYSYPCTPGDEFEYWLHESEIELLQDFEWPHKIVERIMFALPIGKQRGTDPLRKWQALLMDGIVNAEQRQAEGIVWEYFRAALRSAALNTIGQFGANGKGKVQGEFDHATRHMVLHYPTPMTPYLWRYHHPEWRCAITARARVATTRVALRVPPEHLVSIVADAVTTTQPIPGLVDSGKVGSFRLKGSA